MAITAKLVKELRDRTGAAMMDCKKALVATCGDVNAAIDEMRKSGLANAEKKGGRIAADGAVVISVADDAKSAVMLEVNSETDFVAKGDDFKGFVAVLMDVIRTKSPVDVAALSAISVDGNTIEEMRQALIAKIGENIQIRRFKNVFSNGGVIGSYSHGGRIGVLAEVEGDKPELAKDVAMHVAASKPECVSEDQVDSALLEKEKSILIAQAKDSGKPGNIIEKMVAGRMRKFLAEITLYGQAFVKDPEQTVAKYLASKGSKAIMFIRFEVGEGIEKKVENFADEVAAQAKAT
jgi:elongation factor Ts